ncbi:MAG: heterodisulfide reductase, subunit B [Hydrogenophilales bacterium CG03_land_8_20_14_0_80_62_28]|nr:heterodisulfide reductase, subunit B [Betaproteobacteria bacterium]OIO79846.1 MAG: heterodisulfide reductase, subunit B [Hydrogenophilaceae bacterium CG1_02_62_390]PIV24357.1 MAG: heterodisulfide reductase, subunit B [Hydrogenophilales bacterium CG03_land_8_20_14_0_80_62_28]PIW38455.1 MAG: heterodisulfide reductase, subunit B [Hydrogenophilales bacterium CG15_BIG_FIL_POST_REV_8_21_14_020_62_31]PIW71901.1 MAG: heterodisulfide reductase, subunit B [Hydrogenophilales bacterium CG12_big_fil_rev_
MKLIYYPGCTLKNQARNFDVSTVSSMAELGVEVEELARWNCCGTVHALGSDNIMNRVAPVTNLIRVKEAQASEFMTTCAMCYNTLKRANIDVKKRPDALETINEFLYQEETKYQGDVDVLHLLEYLRDRIGFDKLAEKVKKPLAGLRVACYYGCLLVRPKEVAFDDVENPTIMEDLITALGATPVQFPLKTECCGAYHTVDKPEIIAERTDKIMGSAHEEQADLVVVSCPLCAFNLDFRQDDARRLNPDFYHLPVLYFTQLMALAFGCDDAALRFDLHHIDPQPTLAGRGLA